MNKEKTVLVLDDDASVRRSLCVMLTSMGIVCEGFEKQKDFVERINDGKDIAAMLIDMQLSSQKTGLDVLEDVRSSGIQAPAVIMSGWDDFQPDENLSPVARISKPFDYEELLAILEGLYGTENSCAVDEQPEQ